MALPIWAKFFQKVQEDESIKIEFPDLFTCLVGNHVTAVHKETLEQIVNDLIKKYETNFKGIGQPLRVALTGSKFGPGLYDIVISLGKEEVERRLGNKIII